MKKWTVIVIGIVVLFVQVFNICLIFNISQEVNSGKDIVINKEMDNQEINNEQSIMNLEQAAEYLKIEKEQLRRLLVIEQNILDIRKSFSGEMIPYITIDGEYYFSKQSLDEWMYETSKEKVIYDTNKYERSM